MKEQWKFLARSTREDGVDCYAWYTSLLVFIPVSEFWPSPAALQKSEDVK